MGVFLPPTTPTRLSPPFPPFSALSSVRAVICGLICAEPDVSRRRPRALLSDSRRGSAEGVAYEGVDMDEDGCRCKAELLFMALGFTPLLFMALARRCY